MLFLLLSLISCFNFKHGPGKHNRGSRYPSATYYPSRTPTPKPTPYHYHQDTDDDDSLELLYGFRVSAMIFILVVGVLYVILFVIVVYLATQHPNRLYRAGISCKCFFDCCCPSKYSAISDYYESHDDSFCVQNKGLAYCLLGCCCICVSQFAVLVYLLCQLSRTTSRDEQEFEERLKNAQPSHRDVEGDIVEPLNPVQQPQYYPAYVLPQNGQQMQPYIVVVPQYQYAPQQIQPQNVQYVIAPQGFQPASNPYEQ